MLTGYNTDFKFQGKIYHVQTEDGGANSPFITSLLYHQGAILSSRKISYADILKADCLDEVVRELMMEQHKQMIRDLMHGRLGIPAATSETALQTSIPKIDPEAKDAQTAPMREKEPLSPSRSTGPMAAEKEKSLDDIILDFLAEEQKERSQEQ